MVVLGIVVLYNVVLGIDPAGTREPGTQVASAEPQHALPAIFPRAANEDTKCKHQTGRQSFMMLKIVYKVLTAPRRFCK